MLKRVVSVIGVLLLFVMMAVPSAQAAPNTARGILISGNEGLRAVMSTGVGTGNPPAFSFPAKSPDVYQDFREQVHPRNSCIVVDVVHQKFAGSGTTTHKLVLGNFCTGGTWNGGPTTFDLTNATFRSNYVRTYTFNDTGYAYQDEVVDIRIVRTNIATNQWTFYIYNATTGVYDLKTWISGTSGQVDGYVDIGDGGYTQDPTMSCPTLYPWNILEVRGIQKFNGSSWSWLTSGDIVGNYTDNWPCINTGNYQVVQTQPHNLKLEPFGATY